MANLSVQEESDSNNPVVQLHREQNEAIEVVKSPCTSTNCHGWNSRSSGYQASVCKNNSDNAARVAIGDATTDADIMRSVTNMASVGLGRETISVGGDYNEAGGNIDQSVATTTATSTTNTTSTTNNTTTTTTSEANDMSVTDSNNVYTTSDGTLVSLADLEALLANGIEVTVIIDGEEVPVESCDDVLTFGGGCD